MSIKVEPFTVGDFIHIYNRGNKKEPIFLSRSDYWRFLRALRFFNDERGITEFAKCLGDLIKSKKATLKGLDPFSGRNTFEWQGEWGEQKPLVEIASYCLMPNHFHLLLKEIYPGGISKFMKKMGTGYTIYRNVKNGEVGRVFQGQYRGRTVTDERYLQYVDAYIQILNPFELFEGGIMRATEDFDNAFQFALDYPFCSLGESFGSRGLNIINRGCFESRLDVYKEFCKEALVVRNIREFLGKLAME